MTPPRFAHAFMISSVLSSYVEADVLRWDNGKVIPGTQGITPGPAVDLRNWNTDSHNLRYADLSAGLNLSAGDFTGSWLDYAHLQGANLTNALFRFATLSHADVSGAVVTGADLGSAIDFTAEQLYSTASYQAKNLQRVVLGYNDFTGWNFSGQDLSNAAFYGLDPSIADQRGSNLTSANLSGANLSDANFSYYVWDSGYYRGSDLTGSNLSGANLTNVGLSGSTLRNANLTGALLTGAKLRDVTSLGFTQDQFYSTSSYQAKDLRGIELTRNDMTGWNFSGQNLSNATFYAYTPAGNGIFVGSNLSGANLSGANLTNAGLVRANLANANFHGAILAHAWLGMSNLANADLTGVDLSNLDFTASDPSQSFITLGSDLSGANLSGANLTNAVLSYSSVTKAKLTGATVTGARFARTTGLTKEQLYSTLSYQAKHLQGIELTGANLTGWDFSGQDLSKASFSGFDFFGGIVGTNLTNANLGGANLSGAQLNSAVLTNAKLSGAVLTDAQLSSSTLTNADLSGADTRGATGLVLTGTLARTHNTILPNGTISGLNLGTDERLLVRDYHLKLPIKIQTNMQMSEGGTLQLLFGSTPWNSLISFQSGIPVQLGGNLDLTFANGVDITTQVGRTLRIFNWSGVKPAGQFQIKSPYQWDTSKLYLTGDVTLLAVPEPCDLGLFALALIRVARLRRKHPFHNISARSIQ